MTITIRPPVQFEGTYLPYINVNDHVYYHAQVHLGHRYTNETGKGMDNILTQQKC